MKKQDYKIAEMILKTLNDCNMPFFDFRGQGYDNVRNMSGCYNGI